MEKLTDEWCAECGEVRYGPHGEHPDRDVEAHVYAVELYGMGLHPSQDRD